VNTLTFDYVIVGSGLAGTAAAYWLSQHGDVALISKEPPMKSNSFAAQGGIAAAIGPGDHPKRHVDDTLLAGNDLCNEASVRLLAHRAPELMRWLIDIGVPFDRDASGHLALGLEGAHRMKRILHAGGDATGKNVMQTLTQVVRQCPNVHRMHDIHVMSLVKNHHHRVIGVLAKRDIPSEVPGSEQVNAERHGSAQGVMFVLARRATILATGGAGQLFLHTTNPLGATGDGIALAYKAGANVCNLEFVQFHPTALNVDTNPRFLISEAVRGAGAKLMDEHGTPIMTHHPLGDLAPRDVVARSIYERLQAGAKVYLDTRSITDFPARFPTIYERCVHHGLYPGTDPIPVCPAAHFMMGGIAATMAGETSVPGLYAIGEVASTGVHGANRLASNSLLECLVMAFELSNQLQLAEDEVGSSGDFSVDESSFTPMQRDTNEVLDSVRRILWQSAGIVRHAETLRAGLNRIQALHRLHPDSPALCTASLILESALRREESRGAHYRSDFPVQNPVLNHVDTVLSVTTGAQTLEPALEHSKVLSII
jgi:L-aspartate oxidase